jgi:hypothetical protein
MASKEVANVSMGHKESSTEWSDVTLGDEERIVSTEVTSEPNARSKESDASGNTGDSGDALDNVGRVKIGADAALAGISFDFGRSKVMKGRVSDLESSSHFFPKGFARPPGIESVLVPNEDEVVVFEDFSLLAFAYLCTLCSWTFFTKFRCNFINLVQVLLFRLASLFGLSLLVEVTLTLKFSLITMSCIIKTRRFILRGLRLSLLRSLDAYPFTHLDLEIALGLLKPHGTNGLMVGIAIGSTTRYLRSKARILRARRRIH